MDDKKPGVAIPLGYPRQILTPKTESQDMQGMKVIMPCPPKTVYLAGPILGCNKTEANDWRITVANELLEHNIIGISPLRCEPIIGERYGMGYDDPKFGTARAIGSKNLFDVKECDLTLAYLPTTTEGRHQSYGTICELAWAFALGRPSVLVTDDPGVSEHPVINSCAGWLLSDLDAAVEVCIGILGGYAGGKHV